MYLATGSMRWKAYLAEVSELLDGEACVGGRQHRQRCAGVLKGSNCSSLLNNNPIGQSRSCCETAPLTFYASDTQIQRM